MDPLSAFLMSVAVGITANAAGKLGAKLGAGVTEIGGNTVLESQGTSIKVGHGASIKIKGNASIKQS